MDLFLTIVKEKSDESEIELDLGAQFRGKNALDYANILDRNVTAALLKHYPELAKQLPSDFFVTAIRNQDWIVMWQFIFEKDIRPTVFEFVALVCMGVPALLQYDVRTWQRTMSKETLFSTLSTKGIAG